MMLPPRSGNEHCLFPDTFNYQKNASVCPDVCMGMCKPSSTFHRALQRDPHVLDLESMRVGARRGKHSEYCGNLVRLRDRT